MSAAIPPRTQSNWSPETVHTEATERFPLAVALIDPRRDVSSGNAVFHQVFDPLSFSTDAGVGALIRHPDVWREFLLARLDGTCSRVRAQATEVREGTMVVIELLEDDEHPGPSLLDLHRRIAELERLSSTDGLTGVWNRAHLDRVIEVELSRSQRHKQALTLVLLDVDHFKDVNDSHGHLIGDSVLRELAELIRSSIRASDSVFRWGGEEFVVLATGTGHRAGESLAEKLCGDVRDHEFARVGSITVSIGVAEHSSPEAPQDWFGRVDTALYAAKSAGRNRVRVDRRGNSDLWASQSTCSVLQLTWQEAYECGEPTIDAQHRDLFLYANALIAIVLAKDPEPGAFDRATRMLMHHLAQHFTDEEAMLGERGYAGLRAHARAHASLLQRADEIWASVHVGSSSLGTLIDFLVDDVVAHHIFKMDRDFFPLFNNQPEVPSAP